MNFVPMPSEFDGAEDFSALFASLDISDKIDAIDELDHKALAEIVDAHDREERQSNPRASLWQAVEHSCQKCLPAFNGAVSNRVLEENARAAAAGETHLLTDREPVRDRLKKREARAKARDKPLPHPHELPASVVGPILAEARARLAALAEGAWQGSEYARLRYRQGELVHWWAARRIARARYRREPSRAETALVRCLVTGVKEGFFSKRNAQSAFDVIRTLEEPGWTWHCFCYVGGRDDLAGKMIS